MKRAYDSLEKDRNMKRRIVSLTAAFIFIAATFSTAQPTGQEAYLQKCRTSCGDEYRVCLKRAERAGNNERDIQRCQYYNRRCLAKCKPQASPGE
jgi:hypothetical protein